MYCEYPKGVFVVEKALEFAVDISVMSVLLWNRGVATIGSSLEGAGIG